MLQRRKADGLIFLGHKLPKAAATLVKSMAGGTAPIVNGCEFSPSLGVPRVHKRELGEATVGLLLDILRGNVKDAVSVTLPHALIVRGSTAPPRGSAARG
jgi:DNA-binding LacI/PurR family transcriptional regulator